MLDSVFHGKSQSKMDENWGYPYFRKPRKLGAGRGGAMRGQKKQTT